MQEKASWATPQPAPQIKKIINLTNHYSSWIIAATVRSVRQCTASPRLPCFPAQLLFIGDFEVGQEGPVENLHCISHGCLFPAILLQDKLSYTPNYN